jgi:hypothetical protein
VDFRREGYGYGYKGYYGRYGYGHGYGYGYGEKAAPDSEAHRDSETP